MAIRFATLALALLVPRLAFALQVTPNSPCASLCIDSDTLDTSDPNSSTTTGSDIVCEDADFDSSGTGTKWEQCMTCLQNSTFSQGSENDQMWFLYNLRYNFDYCIFGFPNATDVGSSPCITETACGELEAALQDGNLDSTDLSQYGYCDADGSVMTGEFYDKCLACVSASGDTNYITNALVALEAGCLQRPAVGSILGLNDTVFSHNIIEIVDPTAVSPSTGNSSKPHVSAAVIAGIVVGVLLLIAIIAAVLYIRYRKRKNRKLRANPLWVHRPKSSLSFRCQKVLSPTSPKFFQDAEGMSNDMAQATSRERNYIESKPRNSAVDTKHVSLAIQSIPSSTQEKAPVGLSNYRPPSSTRFSNGPLPLRSLTTSIPAVPPSVHPSPIATRSSPSSASDAYFTTPTSTTQLIPPNIMPYVPADHAAVAGSRNRNDRSPVSAKTVSPLMKQRTWSMNQEGVYFPPPPAPQKSPKKFNGAFSSSKKTRRESGSPVEIRYIQTDFSAPPRR
ncbi:LPXTG-domain-containing protein [Pleurostoma richardsiae]|uniref:LPXTG-domain-containing protein n=1 Tax=Pleurostoma richardsiae TaxID=41990 RepID=A0AA38RL27_9PEZI|nr:LPXTG-domain-containing protein [Pleurostoma richardsiae]